MKIYTAHIHARRQPVLVKEGFTWGGFLFGPLWLLAHAALIAGAITLAVLVAICFAAPPPYRPLLAFALFAIIGLFGNDLRRWSLGLGRFRLAHVVAGRTHDEAYFRLLCARTALSGIAV